MTFMQDDPSLGALQEVPHEEPSVDLASEFQKQYFLHLRPLPSYDFLHEPTISRRLADGSLSEPLKLALCAVTALLLGNWSSSCSQWIDRAENLVFSALHRSSMFHLQAMLLIIRYRAASGHFARAFMLAGLASRTAAALRLHYEHIDLTPVAQEVRRRTFWSLYLLDDLFCVGLGEYELCRPETIHLQLPGPDISCTEVLKPSYLDAGDAIEVDVVTRHAAIIKLAAIRRATMKYFPASG